MADGEQSGGAPLVENDQEPELPERTASGKQKVPETTNLKELWKHFQVNPDFFQAIKIDREAGFDELKELWSWSRVVFGVGSVFTLLLNLWTILSFNFNIILLYIWRGEEAPPIFLVSGFLIDLLGLEIPNVAVLAVLEVSLVAAFYVWGALNLSKIFNPLATECSMWHSVSYFFFSVWPTIATVSMVKLLYWFTPAVLTPHLLWTIGRLKYSTTGPIILVYFLASRLGCLFAGFDAFLYKFQLIGLELADQEATGYENSRDLLITVLFFVLQMLGIVQLGVFTKQRIFIFIFAGEDGQMSEKEEAIKRTWEAMVCAETWKVHGIKAIFIWLSFSDADFQRMVLDTKEEAFVFTLKEDMADDDACADTYVKDESLGKINGKDIYINKDRSKFLAKQEGASWAIAAMEAFEGIKNKQGDFRGFCTGGGEMPDDDEWENFEVKCVQEGGDATSGAAGVGLCARLLGNL